VKSATMHVKGSSQKRAITINNGKFRRKNLIFLLDVIIGEPSLELNATAESKIKNKTPKPASIYKLGIKPKNKTSFIN
jgi:hypothetical protein